MTAIAQQILRGCFFNLFSLCITVQAVASCSTLCKALLIDVGCHLLQYHYGNKKCTVCDGSKCMFCLLPLQKISSGFTCANEEHELDSSCLCCAVTLTSASKHKL